MYFCFQKVSWIRKTDLSLLAVGDSVYTADKRFFISHNRHSHYQGQRHSQVRLYNIFYLIIIIDQEQ